MNDTESELAASLWVLLIGLIYAAVTYVVASQSLPSGVPVAAFGIAIVLVCGAYSQRMLEREKVRFPALNRRIV